MGEKATFIMIIGNGACKIDGAASAKKYEPETEIMYLNVTVK